MMLENGAGLPEIPALTRDGTPTTINDQIVDSWAVVLLYRGHW